MNYADLQRYIDLYERNETPEKPEEFIMVGSIRRGLSDSLHTKGTLELKNFFESIKTEKSDAYHKESELSDNEHLLLIGMIEKRLKRLKEESRGQPDAQKKATNMIDGSIIERLNLSHKETGYEAKMANFMGDYSNFLESYRIKKMEQDFVRADHQSNEEKANAAYELAKNYLNKLTDNNSDLSEAIKKRLQKKILQFYQVAAELGNMEANQALYAIYNQGCIVLTDNKIASIIKRDTSKAVDYLIAAAKIEPNAIITNDAGSRSSAKSNVDELISLSNDSLTFNQRRQIVALKNSGNSGLKNIASALPSLNRRSGNKKV